MACRRQNRQQPLLQHLQLQPMTPFLAQVWHMQMTELQQAMQQGSLAGRMGALQMQAPA
jgi:hypothetical protein